MSELNTFILASRLLKREEVVDQDNVPEWFNKLKKMLTIGAQVSEVPLEHRLPLLEKGSTYASEAIEMVETEMEEGDKKAVAKAYAHVALAVFRSCFYELFPEPDLTVLCYLMALSTLAQQPMKATDRLRALLFAHCVANAFRRTRTGSKQMTAEKIARLSKLALNAVAPRNPKDPTPADLSNYLTLMLCTASASLFCRSFQAARETLKPLVVELPTMIDADNADLCHQFVDVYIIYVRCLTEEGKMAPAMEHLKQLMAWLDLKLAKKAPRRVISCINRWRPELSSANNGMLWTTLTGYQLGIIKKHPTVFEIEELAQLLLLMAAHQTHVSQFVAARDALDQFGKLITKLSPHSNAANLGALQALAVRAWICDGLAKQAKTPTEKQAQYKAAWSALSSALSHPVIADDNSNSTQLTIMAKMASVGEHLPNDPNVVATLAAFNGEGGISDFVRDPEIIKLVSNLPAELIVPYWGLTF